MVAIPMLRRKAEFEAVAQRGRARSSRLLVMRTLRTDAPLARIGIATPRKLGGAVERNRVRRRLRALVREHYGTLPSGIDLLVIARPEAARATWTELRGAFATLLRRSDIDA